MEHVIYKGINWVKCEPDKVQKLPFEWGLNTIIAVGCRFTQLGSKSRTSFAISDAELVYAGRVGSDLLFGVDDGEKNSADEGWFVRLSWVNCSVLLAQTGSNGFYDIRF